MTQTLPDADYSRKAAAVMNSALVAALPAEQQWALRDALAEHSSEDALPGHLRRLFDESLHPHIRESSFDPRLHPRDRRGRFITFLRSMPRNSMERFASYSVTRTTGGHWIIEPDAGRGRRHDTPESAAEHAIQVEDEAKVRAAGPGDMDTFSAIFDGFEHNGMRAQVTSKWGGGVQGVILDTATGENAGNFAREIDKRRDGSFRVHHDTFKLKPEYQRRGFGSAFFLHSLDEYRKYPEVEVVSVQAADSVGGYQWARRGFDFDLNLYDVLGTSLWVNNPNRREGLHDDERYTRAYAVHDLWVARMMGTSFAAWKSYGNVPDAMWEEFNSKFPDREDMRAYIEGDNSALDGKFTNPAEVALFGREHRWIEAHDSGSLGVEMWLGKRFMAGASWRGILLLE